MKNMEKHPSSSTTCCIQSVKDTKFKAIHDYTDTSYILGSENLVNKMLAVRKIEVGEL